MKKQLKLLLTIADKFRDERIEPSCIYAGTCGGCALQHFTYDTQLAIKKEYCNALLNDVVQVDAVEPSLALGYRNRMDYVTAFGKIGLRRRGSFKHVVDLHDCLLLQDKSRRVFAALRKKCVCIEDYDYLTHKGYLRYVVLRQGYNTGQVMVNFVVAREENNLRAVIDAFYDAVDSISVIISGGLADVSYGKVFDDIKQGYIEETLDGIRYRITPNSFFQANTCITQLMYREIAKNIYGKVLDMYCGVGSISLFIAAQAETVTGVELNQEAVAAARVNANINNIENVSFVLGDACEYLCSNSLHYDVVIVDPPRTGLGSKVVTKLLQSRIGRIVYMSCNPATFAQDAAALLDAYTLRWCKAYDMFPQTPHMELLAVFDRK
ncbi:MAG: 23S rRNA (uracil(1939)-C(5))-methyltransferase RlmD [Spirochaetes bacterium]|nr:23S rRNA (uracil(1939)-C(5))-methyltransferase RlmD [Spirochaetota bacterium]